MTAASPIMKDLAKNPPPQEGEDPSGKGSPKLKGKKDKGQEQSQSEKKPKRLRGKTKGQQYIIKSDIGCIIVSNAISIL